jgi:uncharacterized protein (TIGR02284 family)
MNHSDDTIDTCNELLRGEISAVETYTQAIEKFGPAVQDDVLQRIRDDHEESVTELRRLVMEEGGEPSPGSGVWGGFTRALEGTAKMLGESPALKVLQEGEEHGLKLYRSALENPNVSSRLKDIIRDELMPQLNDHIIELERRLDRAA